MTFCASKLVLISPGPPRTLRNLGFEHGVWWKSWTVSALYWAVQYSKTVELNMSPEERKAEAAVADAMTLFTSLTTAAEVWAAVAARRQGRDPSGQEARETARAFLREARGELLALLVRLSASLSQSERGRETHLATLVRRGSDLMLLQRAERLLHGMHQRLMSLYPEVPEEMVEEARRLRQEADELLDPENDAPGLALHHFTQQASIFCDEVFREML